MKITIQLNPTISQELSFEEFSSDFQESRIKNIHQFGFMI